MTKKKIVRKKAQVRRKGVALGQSKAIEFHYLKASDFRSVHVDGAIGGLTTKGFLHIALFTERSAIPQTTTHNILPDGKLGDEVREKRQGKQGIVRQMEVDLIMNEDTARDLRNWIDQRLEEFEDLRKQLEKLKKTRRIR